MRKLLIFLLFISSLSVFAQTQYVDLTKVLPKGYVKDGTVDYTNILQKAIDGGGDILFPNFPIQINDSGLKLKSNCTYKFQASSKLILKPSAKSGYNMLDCNKKENITILNPVLIGDKKTHLGSTGEWGFGISIRGAKNIRVENAKIYDCFGDGIYIGRLDNIISDRIVIINSLVSNSRRNGLSITSGTNIRVSNSKFLNSKGKGPSSGIDIEPNGSQDELKWIVLENINTGNNENWGLLVNLVNLRKDNARDKDISITINNFSDNSSKYGMSLWLNRKNNYSKNISGYITMNNVSLLNNTEEPIKYYNTNDNTINVAVNQLTVDSKNYNKLQNSIENYHEDQKIKFKQLKTR
jgi:hypothetical protein